MTAPTRTTSLFAWQGFRVDLPARWNPVKLDGAFDNGHVLIADLHGPQLGLRWRRANSKGKLDATDWARRAIEAEVGKLAAGRAKPLPLADDRWPGSMLCLDADPPGRDIWVAHSLASNRVVEVVHHVRKRDRMLEDAILPTLRDTPTGEPRAWVLFDLSCTVPGEYELKTHRLNAGDLGLTFANGRASLAIRQIALARLALQRMPLDKWLVAQEALAQRHYRAVGDPREIELSGLKGLTRRSHRRRRFAFMRWLPPTVVTIALHDLSRDRLVLAQGSDEASVMQVAETAIG
jgi:hypothetical protein